MNRDLFLAMLKACADVSIKKNVCSVGDDVSFAVLLEAGSAGSVPVGKVQKIRLTDDFVTIETEESTYLFPYAKLSGVKWSNRGGGGPGRTGFHA